MSRAYFSLTLYDAIPFAKGVTFYENEVHEEIKRVIEEEIADETNGGFDTDYSWSDMEKEMCEFSKKYPDMIFKVHTEGEEEGALCDTYFHDGKFQECPAVITYPPFDSTLLIDWEDERNGYLQLEKRFKQ